MERRFMMGADDWLTRARAFVDQPTSISPGLRRRLTIAAINKAYEFYSNFLGITNPDMDLERLASEYESHYAHAISLGLFTLGSIREKDHLSLWCLGQVYSPDIYVESGVFIGGSLHSFINSPKISQIVAIDPNLSRLKIPEKSIPGAKLINDKDFSQIDFSLSDARALVYFDDHINAARRIIQASEKGFQYLLFDDSTGLEGICQRLHPAIPTIPMIMNAEILSPGDELAWTHNVSLTAVPTGTVNSVQGRGKPKGTRVSLQVTQDLIEECLKARRCIRKCELIPNLGEFIPQQRPTAMIDISKYMVELHKP